MRDITNCKRAAEAQRASGIRYRGLFKAAQDGILILDAETGIVVDVNPFMLEMLGFSLEQFLGKRIYELEFLKNIVANPDKFTELQQREYICYKSLPLVTADGRRIDVEFVSNIYWVDHKKVIQCSIRDITEFKNAERSVRRLATVVKDSNDAITVQDFEGRITGWNHGAELMYGYSEEEALQMNIWQLTPPEQQAEQKEFYRRLSADETVASFETRRVTKDGRILTVWLTITKLLDDVGKPIAIATTERDITERKRAEKLLSDSEVRYRRLFEAAKDGILILDAETGIIVDVNPFLVEMLGFSHEQFMGKAIWEIGFFKDIASNKDRFIELQRQGYVRYEDLPLEMANGQQIAVEFVSNIYTVDHQKVIQCNIRDITKRKQVERELERANEKEFRTIFDNATDGILLADLEIGKFYMGNKTICRMLGYSQEEIKNLSIMDIHPKKDLPYVICQFDRQTKREITTVTDIPVKRKNSSVFYADVNSSPVTIAGKTYLMGSFRDITERKQLDEKTRRMEEIKTTSEIKTKFTSMVSHELRSPLGVIKEGINLVLEGLAGNINDEQRDLLDTAKRNTDRLGRLINNVLDFQKIDSGKMWFDILENDINEVSLEVNKTMSLLAKEKGLDLVVDVNDSIPRVRFDKDKIIQVLTNLVSNAIKYTEKGNITISTKQEDNTVHVIVQDTGIGIKAEDMQRLFQAFEQLDGTRDKKKGGTGLGLAISKEIILAHKGKIWAESEVGKGSGFHFILPLKDRRVSRFPFYSAS